MKRKRPDLIITADWHLRDTIPICRTDDFIATQWAKVQEIRLLQKKHTCPIYHAGDLFDHWKPSPHLLSIVIANLSERFFTTTGNHDLPQHNVELLYKSGLWTVVAANRLSLIGVDWGRVPDKQENLVAGKKVLVWHVMTYNGKTPWPGCTDLSAEQILEKYPEYDLIITGHNHKTFTATKKGRLLINPGSITRQSADQIDHCPCVFLWYGETNTAEPYYLNYPTDVISNQHIEVIKERNDRISAFIERLTAEWESDVDFERNIELFLQKNQIRKSVIEIVRKACDLV